MKCKVCDFDKDTNDDGWHNCTKHLLLGNCEDCDNVDCGCRECSHWTDCGDCGINIPAAFANDVMHDLCELLHEEFVIDPECGLDIARDVLEGVFEHSGPAGILNVPEGLTFVVCNDETLIELP